MEQFQYRSKARIIAIVDLVLTSMTLWVPLVVFMAAIGMTVMTEDPEIKEKFHEALANNPDYKGRPAPELGAMVVFIWILFVISLVVVIVQLVAAVKLVNATQLGKDAVGAAKLSRFWRNCTIVFTVLLVLGGLKPTSLLEAVFTWGCFVLRCIGIYVVQKFITELDIGVASGVLPMHQGQVPMNAGMAYAYIPPQQNQGNPPNYNDVIKQ